MFFWSVASLPFSFFSSNHSSAPFSLYSWNDRTPDFVGEQLGPYRLDTFFFFCTVPIWWDFARVFRGKKKKVIAFRFCDQISGNYFHHFFNKINGWDICIRFISCIRFLFFFFFDINGSCYEKRSSIEARPCVREREKKKGAKVNVRKGIILINDGNKVCGEKRQDKRRTDVWYMYVKQKNRCMVNEKKIYIYQV